MVSAVAGKRKTTKKTKAKRGRGRPRHVPTAELQAQVQALIAFGVPEDQISTFMRIDPKTLRQYYRFEIDTASTMAIAKVAGSLYKKAISDTHPQAATCAIFFLKTRAGWKETSAHEHSGKDGAPIQVMDLSKLTDAQLVAIEAAFRSAGLALPDS